LRRELRWRNLDLTIFEVVGGNPRKSTEEGGPLLCVWGNLGELSCKWGDLRGGLFTRKNCEGRGVSLQYNVRDELFTLRTSVRGYLRTSVRGYLRTTVRGELGCNT
jgi:hypothetical protein